jgi:hypothetical protein
MRGNNPILCVGGFLYRVEERNSENHDKMSRNSIEEE